VPGAAQASLAAQQSTSKHFLITTRTVGNGEGALGSHPPRKPA
jgi:hypothetical protein